MKRTIVIFLFSILGICRLQSQQDTLKISLVIEGEQFGQIAERIRDLSGTEVYFATTWFEDRLFNGVFQDLPVAKILEELLKDLPINYFQYDAKTIVLTRNNRIYEDLPDGFFGDQPTASQEDSLAYGRENVNQIPVFINQEMLPDTAEVETLRIGTQVAGDLRSRYQISGYIREQTSGQAVSDVSIRITNRGLGTVSDENGYFEIMLPPGINELETRFIGMKPIRKRLLVFNDGKLDLAVEEGVQQLEEVVVEADRKRNVEAVTAGTDIIDSEESKNIPLVLGERNLLEIATALPGISRAGEGATGINVRGGRTDQNMFLLNDALVYNPTHFFGIFQALNPFVTESVEIYKGAIPVTFGGRLSSVFDIRTTDGDTNEFRGEGSVGPVTANLAFEIPLKQDKSSLVIGGRGAYSDWVLRALEDENLNNSQASFYDFIGTYTDRIDDKNRLKATAYYSKDRFSITSDSLFGYSNRAVSLGWDRALSNNNTLGLRLANSRYAFDIEYDSGGNTDFNLGYAVEETEFKGWMRKRISPAHNLTYGLAAKYYRVNPGDLEPRGSGSDISDLSIPREQALEGALYIADEITLSEKFSVIAGLRWAFFAALGPSEQREYAEGQPRNESTLTGSTPYDSGSFIETYGGPEARISARYLLSPSLSLRAGFNNMYQFIHTLSNTTTVSPIDTWKLSDANIRPQTSQQISLGIFKNLNEQMFELSLEGFYKLSQDVLDFKTGAQVLLNPAIEQEVIQGDGKAYGVEFLIRKNRGKLNGWLGYTYSRSLIRFDSPFPEERVNNGEFFPANYDKPHDLSLVANYKFTRRYSASLNFSYQTGRPVTYPIGQYNFNNSEYVFYSNRNEFRIPDYIRLDLGINIEGNHKREKLAHSFWTISVYNVLGRTNPYSVFFVTEDGQVKALQSSIFAIPIPSITYNFKF